MSSEQNYNSQFVLADANHDGIIDEKEFRQFLGPVIRDERRLSGNLSQKDIQQLSSSLGSEVVTDTVTYEIGFDVAVAGFVHNPLDYEKYSGAANSNANHTYGVGPDVGIGAPNIARKSIQYDPAGAMFNYADLNSDGKIDEQEFGSFMRSV